MYFCNQLQEDLRELFESWLSKQKDIDCLNCYNDEICDLCRKDKVNRFFLLLEDCGYESLINE